MPKYRSSCFVCETTFEWDSPRMTTEDPPCPTCAGATERNYFPVAAIWTKGIAAYGDPKSEGFHKQQKTGGHMAMETDPRTGNVIKTFISNPQEQASYCKRNGLVDPKNLPSNLSIAADGKSYETANRSEI